MEDKSSRRWTLLRRLTGRDSTGVARPARSPAGFGESRPLVPAIPPEGHSAQMDAAVDRVARVLRGEDISPPAPTGDLPFPSTGPHGHRERMRTKLLERGADALADYELLEMLLFFAQPKGDTKPLAKALINRFGSFAGVLVAPTSALLETRGLGPHSVAAIRLTQAAATRLARAEVADHPVLNNWDRLDKYLRTVMAREKVEHFRVLFLDTRNRLLADEVMGRGTINHTPVYPREVVRRAMELHATALILVHNHPSGDPTPSPEDVAMTREIQIAARALSIEVHDHLIVGRDRNVSFRREKLL